MLICFLSFLPGDRLPVVKWDLISPDTIAHFGMYFMLAALLFIGFVKKNLNLPALRLYLMLALAGITFGIFVELVQGIFIYRRYFSVTDIIANGFGTVFGLAAVAAIGRKLI